MNGKSLMYQPGSNPDPSVQRKSKTCEKENNRMSYGE